MIDSYILRHRIEKLKCFNSQKKYFRAFKNSMKWVTLYLIGVVEDTLLHLATSHILSVLECSISSSYEKCRYDNIKVNKLLSLRVHGGSLHNLSSY